MSTLLAVFVAASLLLVTGSLFLIAISVVRAKTLPDRILALDTLTTISIGLIAAITIATGFVLYIDVAIALGLVGFLATVAFARYIMEMGALPPEPEIAELEQAMADEARKGP